jgi:ABC-2 type transport system permease protein
VVALEAQSDVRPEAAVPERRDQDRSRHARAWASPWAKGIRDLWRGWRDYRELWLAIGWYDIRKRYRRSVLGPFWITISLGAFIVGLSLIYLPLVGADASSYLPYLAFGFIAWQLISHLITDGCTVFIANGPIIQQLRAPLSIYIYETVWKHLIIFAHNLLIYVVIVLVFGLWPSLDTLFIIPGLILVSINGVSLGMLLGTLCARFRDIPPIVSTIVQMLFLLTPILWHPDQIPGRKMMVLFNPCYYLVEIIRQPLQGNAPSLFVWGVASGLTVFGFVVALIFFSRFRDRVVYWL